MPESAQPPSSVNAVAVPPGHERAMILRAVGSINYECRPMSGMAGAYVWTVAAPDATLRHWSGFGVGRLYQGPTWAYRDGSKLTGQLLGSASGGRGKLPDQLWRVQPSGEKGAFSAVAFIRRTDASGTPPPGKPCNRARVGAGEKSVYEADYEFYEKRP